mmetsp:Transcript_15921/g.53590  ORF Transcript_15921/g.53590 Transcript_15921/m.53590 type:complete len:273 (+) Transcript_15921:78-896(+)
MTLSTDSASPQPSRRALYRTPRGPPPRTPPRSPPRPHRSRRRGSAAAAPGSGARPPRRVRRARRAARPPPFAPTPAPPAPLPPRRAAACAAWWPSGRARARRRRPPTLPWRRGAARGWGTFLLGHGDRALQRLTRALLLSPAIQSLSMEAARALGAEGGRREGGGRGGFVVRQCGRGISLGGPLPLYRSMSPYLATSPHLPASLGAALSLARRRMAGGGPAPPRTCSRPPYPRCEETRFAAGSKASRRAGAAPPPTPRGRGGGLRASQGARL